MFLDILKAFNKIWNQGLLHKLKQNGISGKLFDIITDFLNFRKQRVVLNKQYSSWTSIEDRVPQGSILGLLVFFIYINDLSDDLTTNVKVFADGTSLFSIVHKMNTSTTNLNDDLNKIQNWAIQWKMNFNPDPCKQLRSLYFRKSFKREIMVKFISITTPLNKFPLKNVLECIVILHWIFRNT